LVEINEEVVVAYVRALIMKSTGETEKNHGNP
jgi:hypothetical protein